MPDPAIGMGSQGPEERAKFEGEVRRIIDAGNQAGITLRLLGSLAFQTHCPRFGHLQAQLGRAYTDIDLASYGSQAKAVSGLMVGLGYTENREIFVVSEGNRAIFDNGSNRLHVDVFYERLDFSHTISWDARLELDSPTIPLAELFLEKMQIFRINEKDIIDTILLLLEHPLGDNDRETVNMDRVAALCAANWGLWRTVTMNLEKLKQLSQGYGQLEITQKTLIVTRVDEALARLEAEPKSVAWRLRARVGDRVKWYKDVDEVQ